MNQASPPAGTSAVQTIERPLEVGLVDAAHRLVAVRPPAEPERVGARPAGERLRVGARPRRGRRGGSRYSSSAGRSSISIDAVAGGAGDQHRLAGALPAVAPADPERPVGGDRRRDDARRRSPVAVDLEGPLHLHPVAGAAADERHGGADDLVDAADHLLLVAGDAVGEQQQGAVGPLGAELGDRGARPPRRPRAGARPCRRGRRPCGPRSRRRRAPSTTTPPSPAPRSEISPAVVQPISSAVAGLGTDSASELARGRGSRSRRRSASFASRAGERRRRRPRGRRLRSRVAGA